MVFKLNCLFYSFNVCNSYLQEKKDSGAFILLSEASHASYSHFTLCTSFVIEQTSKPDNKKCNFSSIYFFINLTFVVCDHPQATSSCIYLFEKTLSLRSINHEGWGFQGFMGIWSLAKQLQSSFKKSLHCHEMLMRMQIPRVLCLRHAVVFFVFQERF